jgi:uncharacterized membrane protein
MELITLIITGLIAGLFLGWTVTVIPGTKEVSDTVYLETMQSINNKIINPAFFVLFFGPMPLLIYQAINLELNNILAAICYTLGTIGVTLVKNVPLNNKVENTQLDKLSEGQKSKLRQEYEPTWNFWHNIRTACSVIAFILVALN